MDLRPELALVGRAIEVAGVAGIALGLVFSAVRYARDLRGDGDRAYARFRRSIGRTLLLGLEVLVAADIVATVAVELSFESLGALAILVAVRTFLSWSLEVETEGRWPWQPRGPRASS